jgi:hypothetical protein
MRVAAVLIVAIVIAAGCGSGMTDACGQYAAAFCDRNLACLTGSDLQGFQTTYGATQGQCVTNYENSNCATSPCAPGVNYDSGQEQRCATDYQNSSCLDVTKPGFQPDSCAIDLVCHN